MDRVAMGGIYPRAMVGSGGYRVFASGAYELWAGSVRPRHRLDALGNAALHLERPLHLAAVGAKRTMCGMPVVDLREYPVVFSDQDVSLRCPLCEEATSTIVIRDA
jgi:hypothetical protein